MVQLKERCFQCDGEADQHPVVAVVSVDILAADPTKSPDVLGIKPDNKFALVPVCAKCHREPKLDAHYFYRQDAAIGLARSGSSELG